MPAAPPNPIKNFRPKLSLASSTTLLPAIKIVTKNRMIFFSPPLKLNSNNQHKGYIFGPNFVCQRYRTATRELCRQMKISWKQLSPPALAPQTPDIPKKDLSTRGVDSQARMEAHQRASAAHTGKKSCRTRSCVCLSTSTNSNTRETNLLQHL